MTRRLDPQDLFRRQLKSLVSKFITDKDIHPDDIIEVLRWEIEDVERDRDKAERLARESRNA